MELETYEANLADFALQEQTFYETKPTQFELELAMASQLASTLSSQNCHNGHFTAPSNFTLAPIISHGCKGSKKKKSVKFLTYVQVSLKCDFYRVLHMTMEEDEEKIFNFIFHSRLFLSTSSFKNYCLFLILIRNALNV